MYNWGMSETREAYSTEMQPGRELDAAVARVILGEEYDEWSMLLDYSTAPAAALLAWAWLEEHHPWTDAWGEIRLFLGRDYYKRPAVFTLFDYRLDKCIAVGTTYPHAVALAVVEAGKALEVIE